MKQSNKVKYAISLGTPFGHLSKIKSDSTHPTLTGWWSTTNLNHINYNHYFEDIFMNCKYHDHFGFSFSKFSPKAAQGNIYRTCRGFPQPCLQYTQLDDFIFPMLSKLGPHISIDPVLMVKIIRVTKGFLKEVCRNGVSNYIKLLKSLICKM